MATASQPHPRVPAHGARMTLDEFLALPDDTRAELVDGVLVMSPPTGGPHGDINARLLGLLAAHVYPRDLGYLFDSSTAFLLRREPPLVRSPDVAFVPQDRLPRGVPRGPVTAVPDLAVEVLSPSNRPTEITRKVAEYLSHGARLVWVIDPEERNATVHTHDPFARWLGEEEALDGADVLPGFSAPLRTLFAGLAREAGG